MNSTEILLAFWNNCHTVIVILMVISAIVSAFFCVGFVYTAIDEDRDEHAKVRGVLFRALPITVVLGLVCTIPDTGDLWKVRVDLIKLQLASPANVQAGVDHIDEVAKALECKYLNTNCPKEHK